MINLRKNQEKLRSAVVASAADFDGFSGIGVRSGRARTRSLSIDKRRREDGGGQNRRGGAALRGPGRHETRPEWLSRRCGRRERPITATMRRRGNWRGRAFYVGDRTDNDSERDDMFREGTEAGKAAVQLQPDKPEGHFWLGANYGGSAAHSTIANLSSFQDIKARDGSGVED